MEHQPNVFAAIKKIHCDIISLVLLFQLTQTKHGCIVGYNSHQFKSEIKAIQFPLMQRLE